MGEGHPLGFHNKRNGLTEVPKLPASAIPPCAGCRHEPRCALFERLGCDALVLFMHA